MTFRDSRCRTNNIKKLHIKDECTFQHVQFFLTLCPQLQYFQLIIDYDNDDNFELIMRLLLCRSSSKNRHLFSFDFSSTDIEITKQMKTIIDTQVNDSDHRISLDPAGKHRKSLEHGSSMSTEIVRIFSGGFLSTSCDFRPKIIGKNSKISRPEY